MHYGRADQTRLLESWARWVSRDGALGGGQSMLSKLIDNKGMVFFGATHIPVVDCIEARIEARLMQLYNEYSQGVELLRLEYGAVRIKNFNPCGSQTAKAHSLGMSLRSYQRHLSAIKTVLFKKLG